jgi:hypothetical protein
VATNRRSTSKWQKNKDERAHLVDFGPSADLDEALAALDRRDPEDYPVAARFAVWGRARLAARQSF